MPRVARSQVHELCDGEVILWAEAGEPIMLKAIDSQSSDPAELNVDEARQLAAILLELADWCDAT